MKSALLVILCLFADHAFAQEIKGKFTPPAGKVLVFAGQDNISVGGTEKYNKGYVIPSEYLRASPTIFISLKGGQMGLGGHSLWGPLQG